MDTTLQIFVQRDEQQHGPYSRRVAKAMLKDGTLSPDDLAWHEGMEDWQPLSSILQPAPESPWWRTIWHETVDNQFDAIWRAIGGVFLAMAAAWWIWTYIVNPQAKPTKGKPVATRSDRKEEPGLAERLVPSSPDDRAKRSAQTLVLKNLKAPATAQFAEVRILKKEHPWYQLLVAVDAQNGFGALIRSYFICVVQLEEGEKFTYHPAYAVEEQEDPNQIFPFLLERMRAMNKWPGAKDPTKE